MVWLFVAKIHFPIRPKRIPEGLFDGKGGGGCMEIITSEWSPIKGISPRKNSGNSEISKEFHPKSVYSAWRFGWHWAKLVVLQFYPRFCCHTHRIHGMAYFIFPIFPRPYQQTFVSHISTYDDYEVKNLHLWQVGYDTWNGIPSLKLTVRPWKSPSFLVNTIKMVDFPASYVSLQECISYI